ncbi:hypothetical protein RJ640_030720 [Escallonia rubra]|uniref:Uncharacterized protein n=1 Tax=Escallonia rubra TaxID=112253 RepID=A0AA88U360_9ASTE|nr:hypothetical protein RJ640_030720 [Escallonia rubra]
MKVRSWLATCSTTNCISTADYYTTAPLPPENPAPKHLFSDTSTSSTSSTSQTTISSLESNLSLQTLPSVPSLQTKLSSETLNLAVTHHYLTSLNHRQVINSLVLHRHLLYAVSGNHIHVYDATTYVLLDTFNAHDPSSGSVKSVTFSNTHVFTAHQDSKIRVWLLTPAKRHKLVATLPTLEDRLRRLILPKNYVHVRRHKKRLWIEHNDAVSGLALTGGDFMCSVSWDKYMKIWRTSDFRCVESVKAHDDAINAVVVAKDSTIYTASADRRIKVWGRPAGEKRHRLIATLEKHKSAVNALALNGDGSVLFSGACDRSILVWEREDSANHMVVSGALRGHSKAILCLTNACDLLFSGSADKSVRVWQRGHEGKYCCLTVLNGHEKPVRSLVTIEDRTALAAAEAGGGVKVFSGSFDGEIRVWQVVVSSLSGGYSADLSKWKC